MRCSTCNSETSHIRVVNGVECCPNCTSMSEAGGTRTDGLLSRNSFRIRHDSIMNEGDTLPPHAYNKHSRKVEPRDDFVRRFPDKAPDYFSRQELDKAGYKKLKEEKIVKNNTAEHHGEPTKKFKEIL